MKTIKIKNDGSTFLEEQIDDTITSIKIESIKEYLACEVEFEEGLTLGMFLKLLFKDKEIYDIIFSQELNGKSIKYFEELINKKDVEKVQTDFKIDSLEITKIFEFLFFDKNSTIDLFTIFLALGKTEDDFDIFIPISLCSINELKDINLYINKSVDIYRELETEEEEDGNEDEEVDDETESNLQPLMETTSRISLYEAIQSILYEISFYQTEEDRISARENQNGEHMIKEKIAIKENQLKKYISEENFEKAAVIKREIDKIKNSLSKS